jgi:ABC-type Fe3+ transport system permease subunit
MATDQLVILWISLIILAVLAAIAVLIAGVLFLIRFSKTRNKKFLVAGLILTLLLPGCLLLLGILLWLPTVAVGYGPAPSNYVP